LFRDKFASLEKFNPACEKVVTSARLVFAFTMLAMLTSDLRTIGQLSSTYASACCSTR
jgi:MMPL family